MNNLTILLTLRERANYTKTWFLNNYFTEVNYLIADGSVSDENELFFKKNQKNNVKYVRFPADQCLEDYHKKVRDASLMVETPYVMTCDNDDFLNIYGIKKCVDFLEEKNDYGFCGGKILGVIGSNKELSNGLSTYKLKYGTTVDNSSLDNLSGENAIKQMFRPYRYIWYSVYRIDIFQKTWKNVYEAKLESGHLVEMMQSQLSFCYGKYKDLNINTYIRLENPPSSDASEESALGEQIWSHSRICFDANYRSQVKQMAKQISEKLKIPVNDVTHQYAKFYTYSLVDKNNLPIKSRLTKMFMRLLTRMTPKVSMPVLIRCVNFLMR